MAYVDNDTIAAIDEALELGLVEKARKLLAPTLEQIKIENNRQAEENKRKEEQKAAREDNLIAAMAFFSGCDLIKIAPGFYEIANSRGNPGWKWARLTGPELRKVLPQGSTSVTPGWALFDASGTFVCDFYPGSGETFWNSWKREAVKTRERQLNGTLDRIGYDFRKINRLREAHNAYVEKG